MPRAVFMGSDSFSVPILQALLDRGPQLSSPVTVSGVVTQPDRPAGRGRKLVSGPVKELASMYGVPVLQPERVRGSAVDEVLALQPDVIVVASFGQILPRSLIDAPPRFSLNLHPSLLPRYRGATPIPSAILSGDGETGVTLMRVTAKMDAGPILDQVRTPLGPEETSGELTSRLAAMSAELLLHDLPAWLAGTLPETPQDDAAATYTVRFTKEDARIQWDRNARTLARQVLAFNPRPMAHTYWRGRQLRLLRAVALPGSAPPGRVVGLDGDALRIGTGEGLLGVTHLQLAGGRPVTAPELVRGHGTLIGDTLESPAWLSV